MAKMPLGARTNAGGGFGKGRKAGAVAAGKSNRAMASARAGGFQTGRGVAGPGGAVKAKRVITSFGGNRAFNTKAGRGG